MIRFEGNFGEAGIKTAWPQTQAAQEIGCPKGMEEFAS
jgi:hypothetical protein